MPKPTWEAVITVEVDSDNPDIAWVQLKANKWGWSLSDDGCCYAEDAPLEKVPELVHQALRELLGDKDPFDGRPGILVIQVPQGTEEERSEDQ